MRKVNVLSEWTGAAPTRIGLDQTSATPEKRDYRNVGIHSVCPPKPHSDKTTYRDLACHICQMSVGAISREIQVERNRPYRESRYPSLEISTDVAIFDARCLQTEELSHQAIDSHRMRRDG